MNVPVPPSDPSSYVAWLQGAPPDLVAVEIGYYNVPIIYKTSPPETRFPLSLGDAEAYRRTSLALVPEHVSASWLEVTIGQDYQYGVVVWIGDEASPGAREKAARIVASIRPA